MAVQIQLRNDTAANWSIANPVLARGEVGVEIDTNKIKIGNGLSVWENLSYSGIDSEELIPLVSFDHVQGVAANVWSLTHNLGFYPTVNVFDTANSLVEGAIEHTNKNALTITFSVAITGTANLS
jgi:hypothetical protein